MKHSVKRILALVLMFVMIAALGTTAMATEASPSPAPVTTPITGTVPSENDTATVQIKGFDDDNVTLTAYLIVKANYYRSSDPQQGFAGYEVVEDPTKAFVEEVKDEHGDTVLDENGNPKYQAVYPTSAEISLLAKKTSLFSSFSGFTLTKESETYTATKALGAGEYMVIAVDNDGTTVYNPMLVSVYYTDNGGKLAIDPITISDFWDGGLAVKNAYVKSTTPGMDKEITDASAASNGSGKHGDDVTVGSVVHFKVDNVVIPSYSEDYFGYISTDGGTTTTGTTVTEKNVVFSLTDELDIGLTLRGTVTVKIGGVEFAKITDATQNAAETDKYTYTYTAASGSKGDSFKFVVDKAVLRSLAGKTADERKVEVTYEALVNSKVKTNYDPNTNTMTLEYTNKTTPDSSDSTKKLEDTTYVYTFEIDGKIYGTTSLYKKTTHELIKINEKGEPVGEKKFTESTSEEYKVPQAVQGAVFELVSKADSSVKYYAVTDANGYFVSYTQYLANGGPAKDSFKQGSVTITKEQIGGFRQLDAGEYTMKEVVAPEGFSLDAKEHSVVISATYYGEDQFDTNGDPTAKKGQLESYKILIDGAQTSEYVASYDDGKVTEVPNLDKGYVTTTYIKNTRIPRLPSTGGIGTYLFTVIGVAILTVAAVLVVRGKRKGS